LRIRLREVSVREPTPALERFPASALLLYGAFFTAAFAAVYMPEFGARPLRRTIQRQLDNRLSAMLLAGTIDPGSHLRVDVQDGELSFHAEPPPTGDAATVSHAQEAETPTSQRMTA
jgi:hypothetical protein